MIWIAARHRASRALPPGPRAARIGPAFRRGALLGTAALFAFAEGLPAVITITLAIGLQRIVARRAVIRRQRAVKTLGATSVICVDRTGTLTRNGMTGRRRVTKAGARPVRFSTISRSIPPAASCPRYTARRRARGWRK